MSGQSRPLANVYIDGYNLYFGCVRGTPYKWLDIGKWCRFVLPDYRINRIRYFTALVEARPDKPDQQQNQLVYLRALRTIPHLVTHEGFFLTTKKPRKLAAPLPCAAVAQGGAACVGDIVRVLNTEEKGSDVNLATFLLMDALDHDGDVSVVVSNDSDLVEPIRQVMTRFSRDVIVLNPHTERRVSRDLAAVATTVRTLSAAPLRACQFPDAFTDQNGTITKPPSW
jgi:uncharacterized LabA/DUF88 family protein